MTNWFISINGEQKGPYPTDQLRQLVADGFVPGDAFVWREGMDQWQPLSQVNIVDNGPAMVSSVPQSRTIGSDQREASNSGTSALNASATISEKRILPAFLLCFLLGFLARKIR